MPERHVCSCGGPEGEDTCPLHGELPQHLADLEDALAEADADQQWLPGSVSS